MGGSSCYALPPVRISKRYIYPGIASRAVFTCHIEPLYEFGLYLVYGVLPEETTTGGAYSICIYFGNKNALSGGMGLCLTLFLNINTLLIDTIVYSVHYYIVDSLTDP